MEPQNPPSKIARLADSGFGSTSKDDFGYSRMQKITNIGSIGGEDQGWSADSAPIGLGLELGCGGSSHGYRHTCPKLSGFTFLQLQELEHQALIYKHMEAGLPVPYHLLLPIWKSVVSSLDQSSYPPHYPTFSSPMYMDLKRSMDPEPGRCRRTDGKKWRCSKEAVEEHKYCERHINRGRQQRSRKHVEPSQVSNDNNINRDFLNSNSTNP